MQFQVKQPGPGTGIRPFRMDFGYSDSFGHAPPDAYERLLLDAARGDSTLFTRSDEVEAAWSFLAPILEWCGKGDIELPVYPAGTWGPGDADKLIHGDGRTWHGEVKKWA